MHSNEVSHFTRVGWKVHRLTKELYHSNKTWQALNSTFPDTSCIFSFQINPHRISKSWLWKEVLETFQNDLENWRRESCFTRTMFLHTSLWLQWLPCMTVASFELVDHPPYSPDLVPSDYFQFPTMKKHLAGKQYRTEMMRSYHSAVEDSLRIRMRASIPSSATPIEGMYGQQGRLMLKNKPHCVKFDHRIIVSLWTLWQFMYIGTSSSFQVHVYI